MEFQEIKQDSDLINAESMSLVAVAISRKQMDAPCDCKNHVGHWTEKHEAAVRIYEQALAKLLLQKTHLI